jgi:hypothetical protein
MNFLEPNYEVIAIGNVYVRTRDNPYFEKSIIQHQNIIEEIWNQSLKERNGNLFNGTLANFIKINTDKNTLEVVIHFVEYKQFIAQRNNPGLKLNIKPVGVSGITILNDGNSNCAIFAKRSTTVTEYPGFLELIPSGSIDTDCVYTSGVIDYKSKILSEFVEESGIPKESIRQISGFAFVLDRQHNVYDICCEILFDGKKESIEKQFLSEEYATPTFVNINDLDKFVESNSGIIVPTSLAIIKAYETIREKRWCDTYG